MIYSNFVVIWNDDKITTNWLYPNDEANAILFDGPNQSLWQIAITTSTTLASFITQGEST